MNNGISYEYAVFDEIHNVNKEEDGDWRVKDNMGRIWFVNPKQLSDSPVALSRGETK